MTYSGENLWCPCHMHHMRCIFLFLSAYNKLYWSIFINSISWNLSISSSVQSRWSDHSSACRNDTGHLNASGRLIIHIYFSYPPNCISCHFSNVFLRLLVNCVYWNHHIIIIISAVKLVFLPGMIRGIWTLFAGLSFSSSAKHISRTLSNVFLWLYQQYFSN